VLRTVGRAQLQVSNGTAGVDASLIERLTALPEVEVASGTVQYDVRVPSLQRRITIFGVLFGADHTYREAQFGVGALKLPDAGTFVVQPDSIAPSTALVASEEWALGSTIGVVGPKGRRTLTVRGAVDASGALSVFGGDVAVMDSDAAQHAFGELDRFHWIDVVIAANVDLATARASVVRSVGDRGVVKTPFGRSRRMEAMLGTLRWMMTACGTVAMLVGVFLIHHTVATAVRQRRSDLTRLRALGATRRLVATAVLTETALVGVVGAVLGVGLGIGFAALAVRAFSDAIAAMYISVPPPPVTLTPGEIAAALMIGEGTVLLAAALPCFALLRLRPFAQPTPGYRDPAAGLPMRLTLGAAALVGFGLGIVRLVPGLALFGGVAAVAIFAACLFIGTTLAVPLFLRIVTPVLQVVLRWGWGRPGVWIWQQVRRHQFHTATTMGALAAAVAFTIGLTTLLGSYRGAVAQWISQTLTADVFVNGGGAISLLSGPTIAPELRDEIGRLEGVTRVMSWRFVQVEYRDRPVIVQAASEGMIAQWHPDVALGSSGSEVVISDTLAERFDLEEGDPLTVPAPIAPLESIVRAVRPDYLLDVGNLKVEWSRFVEHFGDQGANILFVEVSDPERSLAVKREIERVAAGRYDVTVMAGGELRQMMDALIDQSFALTTALQALAVLVTVLAMISATSATIIDRAHDLAAWRALGMERRRIVWLLATEAGMVGILAGMLGIAAGTVIGDTLVRVVAPAVAGFRMTTEWPLVWMSAVVLLTALSAGLAAALVAWTQMPRPILLGEADQ